MKINKNWHWNKPRAMSYDTVMVEGDGTAGVEAFANSPDSEVNWLTEIRFNPVKEIPNGHRFLADYYRVAQGDPQQSGYIISGVFLKAGPLFIKSNGQPEKRISATTREAAKMWWVVQAMDALSEAGIPSELTPDQASLLEVEVVSPLVIGIDDFYPAEEARTEYIARRTEPQQIITVRYNTLLQWVMSVIQENVRDYVQITFDVPENYPRDQYGNIRTNVKREPNHLIQQVAEPRNLAGYFWQCAANELEQLGELDFSRCEGFARCRTSLSRNKGAAQKRKWCTPACRVANTRKKGVFNEK